MNIFGLLLLIGAIFLWFRRQPRFKALLQNISIHIEENQELPGILATPVGSTDQPLVFLAYKSLGLKKHIREKLEDLARQGYTAFIIGSETNAEDREPTSQELIAGFKYLQDNTELHNNSIGLVAFGSGLNQLFSAGSLMASGQALVAYYGHYETIPLLTGSLPQHILLHHGKRDNVISVKAAKQFKDRLAEHLAEIAKSSVKLKLWEEARHDFIESDEVTHHLEAESNAWEVSLKFLDMKIKNVDPVRRIVGSVPKLILSILAVVFYVVMFIVIPWTTGY